MGPREGSSERRPSCALRAKNSIPPPALACELFMELSGQCRLCRWRIDSRNTSGIYDISLAGNASPLRIMMRTVSEGFNCLVFGLVLLAFGGCSP